MLENAAVRVLRITYGAGEKSAMHQHPDSIVVPLTASKVKFTLPDGKTQDSEMANEVAQYTPRVCTAPPTSVPTWTRCGRVQDRGAGQGDLADCASGNDVEGAGGGSARDGSARHGRSEFR